MLFIIEKNKNFHYNLNTAVGVKDSMPWSSGPWWKKLESPPKLGLRIILGLLGQSLTYMSPHTRLWVRSLDMA